jgi:hypothetical protein
VNSRIHNAVDRAIDAWIAPLTPTRLAALRILICGFATVWAAARTAYWLDLARLPDARWYPVGLFSRWEGPPSAGSIAALATVAVVSGVAATIGWRFRWTGPCLAASLLVLTTFGQSWSQIFHTENLMVLHVAILAFSPASDAWSLDARRTGGTADPPARPAHGWPVRLMGAVTAMTYLVAGIAKLRIGGAAWITGEALVNHVATDNLSKIRLGDVHSPIGGWLVARSWVFPPLAWASMLIELSAPIAVAFRRTRMWWVAGAWSFHVGILALMAIVFPYQLLGLAFAPYVAVDVWAVRLRQRLRARRAGRVTPGPAGTSVTAAR